MQSSSFRAQAHAIVVACAFLTSTGFAQDSQQQPTVPGRTVPGQKGPGGPQTPPKPSEPKPYKDVVTDAAKTQNGVFKVHRIDDKILWEIPTNLLGRDFLWSSELAAGPQSVGYNGLSTGIHVIRFERRGNRILILEPDYSMRAEPGSGVETGVREATPPSIVRTLPIEAEGPEKSMVIDTTSMFLNDQSPFPVAGQLGLSGSDPNASYIERVTAFPNNIETRAVLSLQGGGMAMPGMRPVRAPRPATATIHWSLNLLPEKPMMGRYGDSRVGYFDYGYQDYGDPKNRVEMKSFIARYRLEKKNPDAEVSDPVKPIVFYISREVPDRWRPGIKRGVEAWQSVFEKAGFSNAILCKDAPSPKEDPTWDPEDSRYSVIRWVPSPVQNAMGPHVGDPRSGETISAHVIVWHNILALVEDWYFAQCGATDPRCKHLPLPDSLINDLISYVVTHEVGHTLGLRHNFKASSSYTIAQLRDPKFTRENGVAASIMDYARFNYVAQPGDGAANIGKVGPYDYFAIAWGYQSVPGANSAEDEKSTLDIWAAKQVNDPKLRYAGDEHAAEGYDPSTQTEDIGDDAVEAGRLGLENIKRIAKLLPTAAVPYGEDYAMLGNAYNALAGQRVRELNHVLRIVGGVVETDYHGGRGAADYTPVPAERQRAAALFALENAPPPAELMDPAILNKLTPGGAVRIATATTTSVLSSLLSDSRLTRMQDNEAVNGAKAYTVAQLVADMTNSIWSELDAKHPVVSLYRRVGQRSFLDTMDYHLNGEPSHTDLKPLALGTLKHLEAKLDKAIKVTTDIPTVLHFQDMHREIEKILLGKKDGGTDINSILQSLFGFDESAPIPGCFQDPYQDALKVLSIRK